MLAPSPRDLTLFCTTMFTQLTPTLTETASPKNVLPVIAIAEHATGNGVAGNKPPTGVVTAGLEVNS